MTSSKPNFLIAGAAKCGTTSLAALLAQHPEINMLPNEVHFFSKNYEKGVEWYLNHFQQPKKVQGEKSPTYLYYTDCHSRIHQLLPDVKLIVMLRNPVARAYSNWNIRYQDRRLVKQGLGFNQANPGRPLKRLGFSDLVDYYLENFVKVDVWQRPLDAIHRSLYLFQVESLLKYFKKENILFLVSERFFKNEAIVLKTVCKFLNLKNLPLPEMVKKRSGQYKKNIPPEVPQLLQEFFTPFNQQLFQLIDDNFREWQET